MIIQLLIGAVSIGFGAVGFWYALDSMVYRFGWFKKQKHIHIGRSEPPINTDQLSIEDQLLLYQNLMGSCRVVMSISNNNIIIESVSKDNLEYGSGIRQSHVG